MVRTSEQYDAPTQPAAQDTKSEPGITPTYFIGLMKLPQVERHDALAKGAPVKAAIALLESYNTIDRKTLIKIVGISQRTLERSSRRKDLLSPEASDRAMRLSEVTELAARVLGGRDLAEDWLQSPVPSFRGRAPLELITTTGGYEAVRLLLNQIDHSVYV